MSVQQAYRVCEDIVRTRARNFSYGIRLLPPPKRRALSAVYAFARRIDDIGDSDGPTAPRLARLTEARDALRRPDLSHDDQVMVALADAARRYPIPMAAFEELIEGCTADVRGATYQTFTDLEAYCRYVAGSVGRLSLGVFGADDPQAAAPLADALGVALQITNILRDVREDRLGGRVYLPAEDLAKFGCTLEIDERGGFTDPPRRLSELVRFEADRAREWYGRGLRLVPLLDRRSAACTAAMAGIYRSLLDRIAADPLRALAARSSLPTWRKALVAGRALSGAGR
ncbi:squalene synthase HpnD [Sphaerisporangium melleum]|uniref:Squalene synthase HpnD n=1 Tax=Sphaerisporangium melleum TaxID=321316 RepID=A0A917VTG0_9ACTN|nr:presqualene diphosphate synthase HpnD [Sphaerisporangium melleum]GGL12919.1 squalene synthase HpnD [Sphaerisporangium melleum]GII69567.1 squalene synthase HpnD [Sphaerisporangium melleum]